MDATTFKKETNEPAEKRAKKKISVKKKVVNHKQTLFMRKKAF
jgi:hypothetical protein